MRITLPESIADITLGQYQKYDALYKQLEEATITEREFIKQKINLFSGIPYNKVDDVSHNDLLEVGEQIDKALAEDSQFKNRFVLNDIEFGFVENLDEITSGEYFDLSTYGTDVDKLHLLMAVLFRPIKDKDKRGSYRVEKYKGTGKYGELMKQMPLNIVNGSLVFFCNLSKELRIHILRSTEVARVKAEKHQSTLSNGGGIQPSTN